MKCLSLQKSSDSFETATNKLPGDSGKRIYATLDPKYLETKFTLSEKANTEEYRPFTDEVKDQVIRLLGSAPIREKIWDWKYKDNPAKTVDESPGVAIYMNDRVVGFNGTMPVHVKFDGSFLDAGWTVDANICEEFRGKGLGKKLYSYVEVAKPLMLAYGMSEASRALFHKRGWKFNSETEEFFFQNRVSTAKDFVKIVRQIPSLFYRWRYSNRGTIEDIPASEIPKECDALWNSVQGDYERIVVRDYNYLKWKYADHPCQDYRALVARKEGRLEAVAIYRQSKRWGRFVDYLGPAENKDLKARLLIAFMKGSNDAQRLNAITTDKEFRYCLRRLGFKRYGSCSQLCVRSKVPFDEVAEGWFLMTGDSDGDLMDAMKEATSENSPR